MLLYRVITAAVLIAILVPVLLWGGIEGVAAIVAVFAAFGLAELARCLPGLKDSPGRQLTVVLGLLVVLGFYAFPQSQVIIVPASFPVVVLVLHLFLYQKIPHTIDSASQMVFAIAYVAVTLCHAIFLRRLDHGISWVFFVIVVICLGDVGAYFAGRSLGRHHFSKAISPSKTIEGLVGGLAGNLAGMLIVKTLAPDLPSYATLVPLTLALAVAGPTGDLCASAIKRRLDIKDFGSIMPGHGGVMDRADSLITAIPTAYYFLLFSGHAVLK